MAVVEVGGQSYHIDDKLIKRWDKIKGGKLSKLDEDRVYVIDGRERSGKSVFTIQQAAYIDPTIINDLSRITFSPEETINAIKSTNSNKDETKVIIFDEAFRGLSSRSVLSKTNKQIVQALMEMGQKNLVLFIVLPSFFLLDMYPAVLRSNALFHISKAKNNNSRSFKVYSYKKKAKLYQEGLKKGWEYKVFTAFKGRFSNKYPGGDEFEKNYRAKKLKSLETMGETNKIQEDESRFHKERKLGIVLAAKALKESNKMTDSDVVRWFAENNLPISQESLWVMRSDLRKSGIIPKS